MLAPTARGAVVGRWIGTALFRTLYRTTVLDGDKVPLHGPVLLASNHSGILDGPLVFGVAPRPAHFLVKHEFFHGFPGWVLRHVGQIPIDRSGVDRTALQTALAALRRGSAVGVFPEGSRGLGDVAAVHQGVTWLAMQSGAPVVPVACLGTRATGVGVGRPPAPGHRVAVVFGDPVTLVASPDLPRRDASRELTEQLRLVLAGHVRASAERTGIHLAADDPTLEDAS
ncbi:lysophospholipid acyltransferase family protein [Angustibacter peucedani]